MAGYTVAWLHPKPGVPFWNGFRDITFGSAVEDYSLPSELRDCMNTWVDKFRGDDFARLISGKGTKARVEGVVKAQKAQPSPTAKFIFPC